MIKLSVVVPTYRPGRGLSRVLDSFDAQTLPVSEWEAIFVDDGSPDDTHARLLEAARTRPNVRVTQIENSGWGSRPRNVGLELAAGEYVLFMDHDDGLYPDALRASYDYASAHRADVLSPKESKTSDPGWGMTNYTRNIPNARETRGIGSLLPMMPHKFYRREFLLEHGIRFPEGRRMLWEDIYFNVLAYRHAERIAVLSEVPVYLWAETGGNNSSTYGPAETEFWDKLTALFEFLDRTLPEPEFADAREAMLRQQFRVRVLNRFSELLPSGRDEDVRMALSRAREIADRFVPERIDAQLGKLAEPRASLLRTGDVPSLKRLKEVDAGLAGVGTATALAWEGSALRIGADVEWRTDAGPLELTRVSGRVLRTLPPELEAVVPEAMRDVTEDLPKAGAVFTVRSIRQHLTWNLEGGSGSIAADGQDGPVPAEWPASTLLDPATAAFGRPLENGIWHVHLRASLLGAQSHRRLRVLPGLTKPAILEGRPIAVRRSPGGYLELDIGSAAPVVAAARPRPDLAEVRQAGPFAADVRIPVENIHLVGSAEFTGTWGVRPLERAAARIERSSKAGKIPGLVGAVARYARPRSPVRLVADASGVRLEGRLAAAPGRHPLLLAFGGKRSVSPVFVHADALGRIRLSS